MSYSFLEFCVLEESMERDVILIILSISFFMEMPASAVVFV